MTKAQLKHLEGRLLEERGRVMKELGYYDEQFNNTLQGSDGDLSSYSLHMWHLNEALRRLYNSPENFGKCHQCGALIDFERLDALPHARLCISCKEKEEDAKKR